MEMKNTVGWFEIYVDDIKRAQKFYETVFQLALTELLSPTPEEPLQMLAFPSDMKAFGCSGALVYMEGFKSGANSTIVYFSCADCKVEEDRVVGANGTIFKPKMAIGEYGFVSLVVDTEGNMIGLHSLK